jgi:hypothetical protein
LFFLFLKDNTEMKKMISIYRNQNAKVDYTETIQQRWFPTYTNAFDAAKATMTHGHDYVAGAAKIFAQRWLRSLAVGAAVGALTYGAYEVTHKPTLEQRTAAYGVGKK